MELSVNKKHQGAFPDGFLDAGYNMYFYACIDCIVGFCICQHFLCGFEVALTCRMNGGIICPQHVGI